MFYNKRCVHIKLNDDTHIALKTILFKRKLSMQELFEEFAQQVVSETSSGKKILESLYNKKVEAFLSGKKRVNTPAKIMMSDIDVDSLYDAISLNTKEEDKEI